MKLTVTVIYILLNMQCSVFCQSSTFTVCNAKQGSPCRLTCTVTPASPITFRLNGNIQGSCPFANDPSSCGSVNHKIIQSGDNTYLDITALDYSRDDGTWTCENNVKNQNADLKVYSPLQNIAISLSKTSIAEGETVTVTTEMKCQYTNDSFIRFTLFKKEKIQSNGEQIKSTTSYSSYFTTTNGCQNHEMDIVAIFTISSSEACGDTQMYAVFTHSYLGSKTGNLSLTIQFPGCFNIFG